MVQTKNRLKKLQDKLKDIDSRGIVIELEDITDTESYRIDENGNKLYPMYYNVIVYDRYNKIIEREDTITDKLPKEILSIYGKKYPGAKVELAFYTIRDGVKQEDDEY